MDQAIQEAKFFISGDKVITVLNLAGKLNIRGSSLIWKNCLDQLQKINPDTLIIDTKDLTYCNGSGVGLINALKQFQQDRRKIYRLINLSPELSKLLDTFSHIPSNQNFLSPKIKEKWLARFGRKIISIKKSLKENLSFTGELLYAGFVLIRHPKWLRWKDLWEFIETVGPNALPIVAVLGFLIGVIMAFQGTIPLEKFGAKMYVPNFVGITLLRELAPLLTAVVVIGRSSSAFAAELGSMKINQEIDALQTMGIDSVPFLAIPRILASFLMLPLLNIFMALFGLIGCGVVTAFSGMTAQLYINQLISALSIQDFLSGLIKSAIYGVVIGSIGCMHGLRTHGGAIGVGKSTTRTVVSGIVMVIIIDGLYSLISYVLNI